MELCTANSSNYNVMYVLSNIQLEDGHDAEEGEEKTNDDAEDHVK